MPSRAKKPSKPTRTRRKSTQQSKRPRAKRAASARATDAAVAAETDRRTKLGTKYSCFGCGAKFYDLNKPEPICPKCDKDQRERPPESQAPPPQPPAPVRRPPRAMASLLDEDEEVVARSDVDEELGIGVTAIDGEEEVFAGDEVENSPDEEDDED